jgi:hypothetical protein
LYIVIPPINFGRHAISDVSVAALNASSALYRRLTPGFGSVDGVEQ